MGYGHFRRCFDTFLLKKSYDSESTRLTWVTLAESEVDHAEKPSLEKVAKRNQESDSETEEEEGNSIRLCNLVHTDRYPSISIQFHNPS